MARKISSFCLALLVQANFAEEAPLVEETLVTATAINEEENVKGSKTRIKAVDLLNRGSVTLPDALQREPGVSIPLDMAGVDPLVPYLQGGSKGINVRGMEGNRVEIFVDGIKQPDDYVSRTFEGAGGPGRIYFDPAVLSSLDINKSAAPGSGSLAGSISGQTESPLTLLGNELVGSAFHTTTSYASSNQSLNKRIATAWGNGKIGTSLVYSYRNGHELDSKGSLDPNPADHESHALVWKAVLKKNDWTLIPTIDYFESSLFTKLDSITEEDSAVGRTTNATNDSFRDRFRGSLDFDYTPSTSSKFADSISGLVYFQSSYSENLNFQDIVSNGGDVRNRRNLLTYDTDLIGFNLSANKEYNRHDLTYRYQGSRSDIEGALKRKDGALPETTSPNLAPSVVWDHGFSIIDEFAIDERWTLTSSLRLQYFQVKPENTPEFLEETTYPIFDGPIWNGETQTVEAADYENTYLSPSIRLEYQASDSLLFFGSYTRGFRNPTAEELGGVFIHTDLSISVPNPDLEAEDSHSFELGLKHKTDDWSHIVSTYYNRYGNFLESNVPVGETGELTASGDSRIITRTENVANVEIYGFEIKSEWTPDGPFSGGSSLSWSEGSSDDGPLNSIDPWKAVAYLAYDDPGEKWGLELSGTYVAPKHSSDVSGETDATDDYFLLDLTGYYHLTENITLRGGLKNLLDQEYVLWSRANRGSGHAGGITNSRDSQPGLNGFLSIHAEF